MSNCHHLRAGQACDNWPDSLPLRTTSGWLIPDSVRFPVLFASLSSIRAIAALHKTQKAKVFLYLLCHVFVYVLEQKRSARRLPGILLTIRKLVPGAPVEQSSARFRGTSTPLLMEECGTRLLALVAHLAHSLKRVYAFLIGSGQPTSLYNFA